MNSPPWGRRDVQGTRSLVRIGPGLDELASLGKARPPGVYDARHGFQGPR